MEVSRVASDEPTHLLAAGMSVTHARTWARREEQAGRVSSGTQVTAACFCRFQHQGENALAPCSRGSQPEPLVSLESSSSDKGPSLSRAPGASGRAQGPLSGHQRACAGPGQSAPTVSCCVLCVKGLLGRRASHSSWGAFAGHGCVRRGSAEPCRPLKHPLFIKADS